MRADTLDPIAVLRDALRHWDQLQLLAADGVDVIAAHGIELCVWDLRRGIAALPPRRRLALQLHVLMDRPQHEVAALMGIRTASVAQYVKAALRSLAEDHLDA